MDRREQSKVLTSSGKSRTEKSIQQKLPTRSDRTYKQNSQLEQETGEAERSYSCSSRREEIDPSSRCTVHTPIGDMALESPCSPEVSEGSEYCSSDSEGSSETEPPVKNDSNSASTGNGTDSDSSNDSSSDSSSNDSSSSGSTSSSDDLNFTESANIPSEGVTASAPRNNLLATNSRASKESLRSYVNQNTSPSSNVVSVDTELFHEPMSLPHCNIEDRAEERKKQAIETKAEEIPLSGYYLSLKQVAQQSRPCVSKPSLETGAADSSTDSAMNPRFHPVISTRSISVDEENVSHIPLPSTADGGSSSLDPTEASRPRNLVRIVMKKSGITRGISAKKLTKNPVINIFGEIVFDGCTFEGESRSPAARAADILSPSELGQKELELNSEEIRNKVCNDILQKGIRRETGEGRGGEDILHKGIGRQTGEGRGRGEGGGGIEYQDGDVDRQEILGGGKIKDEEKLLQTVGQLKDSRNNSVCDISKNLQVDTSEKSTERFPNRLVDYDDDDDVASCQERSNSEDETTSAPSARRISQKKDLHPSERTPSGQRSRRHGPELSRSYSRKRRRSPSTSSADERDSVDGSEHPESTFDAKHSAEIIRNRDDRSSCTTGLKVLKNSDKKFSDLYCSDLQRHTTEKMERNSESQTTRRNLARSSSATTLKILGTKESNDRPANSEVVRNRKVKAVASAKRSKSGDHENLETEEKELSDDEELKRRESRRPRDDSPWSKISNKRMYSSQRPTRSSAKTFSPDCHRVRSHLKRGPRISHTRATTPDRSRKSRRFETRYGETEVRRSERGRRSSEGPDHFAGGKERLDKPRRRSRTSSDRNATEKSLDETRNLAVSKSSGIDSRSTTNRSEQSGKSRSRSSPAYDDVINRQSSRRPSSASTSFKSCPDETCFRVGHGKREKTRRAETRSPSGGHRGDESGTTRPSGCGKLSSSEGGKKAGEGRAERTRTGSSKDRTDVSDHYSHNDNYHQGTNYYPNDWMWSTRNPDHLKETPEPYPFPYLHPFAQPFASPMLRYNPYAYANYCNEDSRRYFLAQQPSSFYPNYHRPYPPYWAHPPLPQNPYQTYVPYETTAGQGEGAQYEEDGECQDYGRLQDGIEDHALETMDDSRSSALKADQELLEDVSESVAVKSSTASLRMGFDALGAAAATEDTNAEEERFSSPSAVQ